MHIHTARWQNNPIDCEIYGERKEQLPGHEDKIRNAFRIIIGNKKQLSLNDLGIH